jgi:hypothetical protein
MQDGEGRDEGYEEEKEGAEGEGGQHTTLYPQQPQDNEEEGEGSVDIQAPLQQAQEPVARQEEKEEGGGEEEGRGCVGGMVAGLIRLNARLALVWGHRE